MSSNDNNTQSWKSIFSTIGNKAASADLNPFSLAKKAKEKKASQPVPVETAAAKEQVEQAKKVLKLAQDRAKVYKHASAAIEELGELAKELEDKGFSDLAIAFTAAGSNLSEIMVEHAKKQD